MLVGARLAGIWHHSRAHRFFATARWSADQLGLVVLEVIVACLLAADDLPQRLPASQRGRLHRSVREVGERATRPTLHLSPALPALLTLASLLAPAILADQVRHHQVIDGVAIVVGSVALFLLVGTRWRGCSPGRTAVHPAQPGR
jgi:hypothetical protein